MKEVAIIGAGTLGLAIGYELSISHPNLKVNLFKKDDVLGKCKLITESEFLYLEFGFFQTQNQRTYYVKARK